MATAGNDPNSISRLLSGRRLVTLVSSIIVSLASGTNYVYSAYAPQLAARLQISHTQLNLIALAGNIGVYSSGPFWGTLIDRRGPRIPLALGFLFLLTGYSGMRHYYDSAEPAAVIKAREADAQTGPGISFSSFLVLLFCSFLTGAGGNGGFTSSVNAAAKSFPDSLRGSANGLVISGFGLSAFLFSTIAHVWFPGDTSSLLLVLALGTSLPMIWGFFFVRPIPLPDTGKSPTVQSHVTFSDRVLGPETAVVHQHANNSHERLLMAHHTDEEAEFMGERDTLMPQGSSTDLSLAANSPPRLRSVSRAPGKRSSSKVVEAIRDLHGNALLRSSDFWLLFIILALLSGTGLMYINNVGSISQALFAQGNSNYDHVQASRWQAAQVSAISVANCAGRIISGLGADVMKNRLGRPRSYCLVIVAAMFVLSQFVATQIESTEDLWKASALLGLAYGGAFGMYPTLCIEWFGIAHFSGNWGFVSLSPMFGGNLFSLAFGLNLDKHASVSAPVPSRNIPALSSSSPAETLQLARRDLPSSTQCFEGRDCYVSSLYLTIFACSLGLGLSVYAAWKDQSRLRTLPEMDSRRSMNEEEWEEEG